MTLPQFITFTGADDGTDIAGMLELSSQYPVEWGILMSPKRHGTPRYPSLRKVREFAFSNCGHKDYRYRMSMHLCGGYSRSLLGDERTLLGPPGLDPDPSFGLGHSIIEEMLLTVHRVQINIDRRLQIPTIDIAGAWARSWGCRAILQWRDAESFPSLKNVDWLYDCSGGKGVATNEWPQEPTDRLVGYAGGIGPESISRVLAGLYGRATNYWIDMESGVRTDDRFDLSKCRAVCEAVYGAPRATVAAA